jgi:high affinity Mn2+ porin
MPTLLVCLCTGVRAQTVSTGGGGESQSLSLPDRIWLSVQANFISQYNPSFFAKYSGPNSFGPQAQDATSRVFTLYTGFRLGGTTEVLFDLESAGGAGLSSALGIAGFTNLDVVRNPTLGQAPYMARAILHQVIPLSSEYDDSVRGPLSLASKLPVRRLELRVGKMSTVDFFDLNGVGSDSHLQFMNWTADTNGAFDYAADTRGYTYGFLVEYYDRNYAVRFGEMLMPKVANGLELDWNLARARGQNFEVEWHPGLFPNRASTIRFLGFNNVANMGSYLEAVREFRSGRVQPPDITATRRQGRLKSGFGVNLEQTLGEGWRGFGRFGWNDGHNESFAYTEVDRSIAFGSDLRGLKWRRSEDKVGSAVILNALSQDHRAYLAAGGLGFLLGDGALNYGREKIWETYYNLHIWRGIYVGADVQRVWNPGYNRDRGPATVLGIRLHIEDAANFSNSR